MDGFQIYQPLDLEQEIERLKAAKEGCRFSKNVLARSQFPWAKKVAARYGEGKLGIDDIIGLAGLGLAYAINECDPNRGRLSTVVTIWVRNVVCNYMRTSVGAVQVPDGAQRTKNFREHAQRGRAQSASLSERIEGDPDRACMLDLLPSKEPTPYEAAARKDEIEFLRKKYRWAIGKLKSKRDQQILLARHRGETLKEIGDNLGLTRERVRQLANRAESDFRQWLLVVTGEGKATKPEIDFHCLRV